MLKAKRKFSKKELKQDQFVIKTLEAKDYIEDNARTLAMAALGVIVVIFLIYMYMNSRSGAEVEAAAMLSRAQVESSDPVTLYNQIISEYGGTDAAGKATFLLAKFYFEQGDKIQAKQYFKDYLDDYDAKNVMTQAAMAGYGDCLFAEGNNEEAARYYERAANLEPDFPQAVAYLYSAAASYEKAGDMEKARDLAQRILDDFEDQNFKGRAEVLLERTAL